MTGESRCQYATTSRQSEYTGTTYMMISIPAVVGCCRGSLAGAAPKQGMSFRSTPQVCPVEELQYPYSHPVDTFR